MTLPSKYDPSGYTHTLGLFEDGRRHVIEHNTDDGRLSTQQRTSAVHCCIREYQQKSARNRPLHVGALGAPDGLEALEGLALAFEPEE